MQLMRLGNGLIRLLLCGFLSTLLLSCASTNLTTTWHDADYAGKGLLHDILIIAVAKEKSVRRLYEDRFVAILEESGIHAVPSYTLKNSNIEPTRDAVDKAVAESGARFVLITRHLSTDTKQHYRPPEPVSVFSDPYYSRVHGYYPLAYREVYYTPGYSYNVTTVSMESNLYDTSTEKLVWSAQSQSIDPKMTQKYIDGLISIFAKDLQEKGLL